MIPRVIAIVEIIFTNLSISVDRGVSEAWADWVRIAICPIAVL